MPGKGGLSLRSLIPAPRVLELRSSRNLGERLLARARQHGLTSEQTADLLGMPVSQLRRLTPADLADLPDVKVANPRSPYSPKALIIRLVQVIESAAAGEDIGGVSF
jgi:hypothetical protein